MSGNPSLRKYIKIGLIMACSILAVLFGTLAAAVLPLQTMPVTETAYAENVDGGTITAPKFGVNSFNSGEMSIPTNAGNKGDKYFLSYRVDFPINDSDNGTELAHTTVTDYYYKNIYDKYLVAYALYDSFVDVDFTFKATLNGYASVRMHFYAEDDSLMEGISGEVVNFMDSESISLNITHSNGADGEDGYQFPSYLVIEILTYENNQGTEFGGTVSNASVTITPQTDLNKVNAQSGSWTLTVSGTNRSEFYSAQGYQNDIPYIKTGDTVEVTYIIPNKEFSHLFTAIFGLFEETGCIEWYSKDEYNRLPLLQDDGSNAYLKYGGTGMVSNDTYFGFRTTFKAVNLPTGGGLVTIGARIPTGLGSGGSVLYNDVVTDIQLQIDNSQPAEPRLDTAPDTQYAFGQSIANGTWFTSNRAVPKYAAVTSAPGSAEYVYAYVVHSDLPVAGLSGLSGVDLAPDADIEASNFSYSLYGINYSATRQSLGEFSDESNADKNYIDFSAETGKPNPLNPGELGLLLVAVDDAGNYMYWLYSNSGSTSGGSSSSAIKVDWTTRSIVPTFTVPGSDEPVYGSAAGKYASVYVLAGDAYHDINGNYNGGDFLPESGLNACRDGGLQLYRTKYVTLKIVMTPEQYNASSIVSYNLENSGLQGAPVFSEMTVNGVVYQYFNLTFVTSDGLSVNSWWGDYVSDENLWNRYFKATVHERVIPYLAEGADELVYNNGVVLEISLENVTMTLFDGSELTANQPDVSIEYFSRQTMTLYSNVTGSNTSPGGYITVGGTQIFYSDTQDMNAFCREGLRFDFEVDGETRTYYIYSLISDNWTWENDVYGNPTSMAQMTAYVVELTAPNGTGGFIDAGTYFYRLFVDDNSTDNVYYGETISEFVIQKADPDPVNAGAYNELVYGQSLEDLTFYSYLDDNSTLIYPVLPDDWDGTYIEGSDGTRYPVITVNNNPYPMFYDIEGTRYYYSTGGVYGVYNIIDPASGEADFIKPGTGDSVHVIVEFVPITLAFSNDVISAHYQNFFTYYYDRNAGGASYALKSGTPHAGNYGSIRFEIDIDILNREVALKPSDENFDAKQDRFVYNYDETAHEPLFGGFYENEDGETVTVPNEELRFLIGFYIMEDGEAVDMLPQGAYPQNAGDYMIMISVDPDNCNYTSPLQEPFFFYLTISRQNLELTLSDTNVNPDGSGYVGGEGSLVFGGAGGVSYDYDAQLMYFYNHLGTPNFFARNAYGNEVGVGYSYVLTKLRYYDETGAEVELAEPEVSDRMLTINPVGIDSGVYILEVSVNNSNYEGSCLLRYNIVQGNYNNNDSYFVLQRPTLSAKYGDPSAGSANIEFGMSLKEAASVLSGGGVYFTSYDPATGGARDSVDGIFYFETEDSYAQRSSDVFKYTDAGGVERTVLDIKYSNVGRYASHEVRLYWQAGKTVDGEFVPDYNFMRVNMNVNIYVSKATVDISEVTVSSLIYGETLGAASFGGEITAAGNMRYAVAPDGKAEGLGVLAFSSPNYSPFGGTYSANLSFIPDDTDRYYMIIDGLALTIEVEKRPVDPVLSPTGGTLYADDLNGEIVEGDFVENAVYRVFGTGVSDPLFTMSAPAIEGRLEFAPDIATGSVNRIYKYYVETEDTNFDYKYGDRYYKLINGGITATTEVGRYLLRLVLDDKNYEGECATEFYVIKSTLTPQSGAIPQYTIEYSDLINDLHIPGILNDRPGTGGTVTVFNDGYFVVSQLVLNNSGVYEYIPVPENYNGLEVNEDDPSADFNVVVTFVPADADREKYERNFRPFSSEYTLTVSRKGISEYICVDESLVEGESLITLVFGNDNKFVNLAEVDEAAFANDPKGADSVSLTLEYFIDGAAVDYGTVTDAGTYAVTISIAEEGSDYCGSLYYTMQVLPHEVYIVNGYADGDAAVMHPYSGTGYNFVPELAFAEGDAIIGVDPSALSYSIDYLLYNDPRPISAPSEIGRYNMQIAADNGNYIIRCDSGTAEYYGVELELYIHPNVTGLGNAEQTYSPLGGGVSDVYPIYPSGHPSLYYNLSYYSEGKEVALPTDAGSYDVEISYNINGLSWSYIAEGGLRIDPFEAKNFLDNEYDHVYDGAPYLIEERHSLLYGLQTVADFKYYSETDGMEVENPINAGTYKVTAEVIDGNFKGSYAESILVISAASLTFRGTIPSVSMYYGSDADHFNGLLKELGDTFTVMDSYGNVIPGAFKIDESDDTAALLPTFGVGNRRIDIVFVPGLYAEDGELYARNYVEFADDISLNILKRNIGEYIAVTGDPEYIPEKDYYAIIKPYNGSRQSLSYTVADGDTAYNVQVNLTYNGSGTAPVTVGEYRIGAYVNDVAYTGSYPGVLHETDGEGNAVYKPLYLIIETAEPVIDYSSVRVVMGGVSYSRVPLVIEEGSIVPKTITIDMIRGLNAVGAGTAVEGTWSLVGDEAQIRYANENYVRVRFSPSDWNSYKSVVADIVIMGDGVDPKVSQPDGEFRYGTTLADIVEGFVVNNTKGEFRYYSDEYGTEALPNEYVVSVGETITYEFIPSEDYYKLFNVVRGQFVPVTEKQRIEFGAIKAFGYMFLNSGYEEQDLHFVFEIYAEGETEKIDGFEYSVLHFNYIDSAAVAAGHYIGADIDITFSHPDYELYSDGKPYEYTLTQVYIYFQVTDIRYNKEKNYNGQALTAEELNLRAGSTSVPVVFDVTGVTVDGVPVADDLNGIIDAGTYVIDAVIAGTPGGVNLPEGVTIGQYYGSCEITFTVTPYDLSDYIRIYGTEKTYDETISNYAGLEGLNVPDAAFEMRYYTSEMASMGTTIPVEAGNYYVVAVWKGNSNYTGSAESEYVILKAEATVSFTDVNSDNGYVYSYDSLTHPAKVAVSNNLTAEDVVITYYNESGNVVSVPGNPGVYRVVAEISDNNYFGSAETTITINKADITITTFPTVESIKYGTKVGGARVSDDFVVRTKGFESIVNGRFEAVNTEDLLSAGVHSVLYRFIPELDYYNEVTATLTVTVTKAYIAIEVASPSEYPLIYDGSPKEPKVISDAGIGYKKQFRNEAGVILAAAPTAAGNYSVTYTIDDVNYEGVNTVEFTIEKASLIKDQSVLPGSVDVRYGSKLSTGIFSGTMVYIDGASAGIPGTFAFDDGDAVLGNVGIYAGRNYTFYPNDSANYSSYRGKVDVNVIKAEALVTGSNIFHYEYGYNLSEEAPYRSFITEPANMALVSEDFDEWIDGLNGGITDGLVTRTFVATVDNANYTGSREFTVIINPRPVSLIYRIAGSGGAMIEVSDQITVNFGSVGEFSVEIDIGSLPPGLLTNDEIAEMQNGLIVKYHDYVDLIQDLDEGSTVKPSAVGEYIVSVGMGLTNLFTVDEDTKYINYTVNRGNVESIAFNTAVLTQTYGNSITVPGVITVPSNVAVEVRFDGLEYVPDTAGEYPISAVVVDPNYNPKTVSGMLRILPKEIPIVNPVAYSKSYDGLPDIKVTAELGGIIVGDEVTLSLTGMTEDGSAEVGMHRVVLTSWTLGGLDAGNYTVREPVYNLTAKITANMIVDPNTESYITTDGGFSTNITADFSEVREARNETNIFTKLFGQKATVQTISVKENGLNKVLDQRVKFYVRIPDEYLSCKNLVVEGMGNLADVTGFTREGNYITFYANTSGEIVFYTTDFPYWVIIVIAVAAIIILGIIVILIAAPLRRRKHIPAGARKIYQWREESGSVEEAYRRKVKAQIEDRKRKWRY